jgi:hypothetical protein
MAHRAGGQCLWVRGLCQRPTSPIKTAQGADKKIEGGEVAAQADTGQPGEAQV